MDRLKTFGKRGAERRRGMPFSLFIVRYFAYVLFGALFLAGAVVSLIIVAVDSGALYPGNYASINRDAMVGAIEERGTASADDIPSCYRWGVFDESGRLVDGDFDARSEGLAKEFLQDGGIDSVVYSSPFASPVYAARAMLEDGSVCVLVYDFNPDFASKTLRDRLPDPQGFILAVGACLFVAMVALIAMRASHMMRRALSPLVDAAHRIGDRELDFEVIHGSVREANDVLDAVDDMRKSLKTSLEAQWAAEQAQRDALSSLAHDLKTPLTIVRGNADLLLESSLDEEQAASARFIGDAACDMEDFIGRIIDVTRSSGGAHPEGRRVACARGLCDEAVREAKALASARGSSFDASIEGVPSDVFVRIDADIVQAVSNLVDNAFEYGASPVTMRCRYASERAADASSDVAGRLEISVEDEGPGFSESALAHASERFYRDDAARMRDGHHGLGLAIASERVRACGGTLALDNTARGARATITLPCFEA